jgi:hypothetical protein
MTTHIAKNRYRFLRQNPIETEKLELNRIVATRASFENVLDAFAGDGTSSRIYATNATHVLAVEKDRKYLSALTKPALSHKISVLRADNLAVMPLLADRSFALLDLDPYGSCYPQIELAGRLLKKSGVILVSSGDIQRVVRGLQMKRFPNSRRFCGRKAVFWAQDVWIPHVLKILKRDLPRIGLVHFFASPVLIRAIFATPDFARQLACVRNRPRYLGWFRKLAKSNDTLE